MTTSRVNIAAMGSASNEEIEREIQAIHAEASRTVDDSLVLSDRIMSDLSATAQIGAETSRNLHEQGGAPSFSQHF